MILIPAGVFRMGSDEFDFEGPPHDVDVAAFYIDRHPVTIAAYARFVEATGHPAPPDWHDAVLTERQDHPVDRVTWDSAREYADWAGKRLPTEAEWEFAARGVEGRRYPWGGEAPDDRRANFGMSVRSTSPVGVYPGGVTPEGVHDLAGNVWEWCADWFGSYAAGEQADPSDPASGSARVLRGGSFARAPRHLRAAHRDRDLPERRYVYRGFRVVWCVPGGLAVTSAGPGG